MIKFDAENHLYINEKGFFLPSVTEIIGDVYGTGLEQAPAELVTRAAEKGTQIHKEIESVIKSGKAPENARPETLAFIKYAVKNLQLEIYAKTEQIVHGRTIYGEFAGTADLICNGWLIDFKTSKTATQSQRLKWQMQLSFYWYALKQANKSMLGAKVLHLVGDTCREYQFEYLGDDFVEDTVRKYYAGEKAEKPAPTTELQTVSSTALAAFERTIKQIKALEEETEAIKAAIKAEMESRKILKLEVGDITISYVAPTVRKSFDSAKFKAEHSELYGNYLKETTAASSIRIKVT